MAYPRPHLPTGKQQDPHAISLKVLRLSRPSLTPQTSLPHTTFSAANGLNIPSQASRAYPSPPAEKEESGSALGAEFPLTPLLTLPAAFGAAYVGESFTCTLCANNELTTGGPRSVAGVRIVAELQTPGDTAGTLLELKGGEADEDADAAAGCDVAAGATLQRTLKYDLKEEGPHVLAVTVSYTETTTGAGGGASGGRARTFRKLYQFVAQQAIAVRSKVTERKQKGGESGGREWILEAQLENVGETAVVLDKVWLTTREGIKGNGVSDESEKADAIVLKPQDVEQVMFMISEQGKREDPPAGSEAAKTGRIPLAQLNIDWRNAMGERGSLTTGWLASRAR